ncbi:MAG: hypothetical protein Q9M13_07870 [Mariprofundales bacterium]|nr:hypothetical protein [Mariprofundales bacterium]
MYKLYKHMRRRQGGTVVVNGQRHTLKWYGKAADNTLRYVCGLLSAAGRPMPMVIYTPEPAQWWVNSYYKHGLIPEFPLCQLLPGDYVELSNVEAHRLAFYGYPTLVKKRMRG